MDDEASTRLITTLNLRSLKYEVEEVRDGEEAIKVRCSMLTPLAKKLACPY
jgi:CheY-like chemotaxis protein